MDRFIATLLAMTEKAFWRPIATLRFEPLQTTNQLFVASYLCST